MKAVNGAEQLYLSSHLLTDQRFVKSNETINSVLKVLNKVTQLKNVVSSIK